ETHPNIPRRVRGVQKSPTKVPVSIRLSTEVIDYFKAQGKGWQTRVDEVLQEFVNSH
ncbi:MAG: BrnA antitoxin family protein, partial [SAR324 cluster bacterium]|nr:BrnA antitoxin family protein [SAR324 cluster bacterium]